MLIAPDFFGYDSDIAQAFRKLGFSVTLYDSRPSKSTIIKVMLRLRLPGIHSLYTRYFARVLDQAVTRNPDFLVLVNPEIVPVWFLVKFRERSSRTRIHLYMWDSFLNKPAARSLLRHCEECFSFDLNDVREVPGVSYLPLFHRYSIYSESDATSRIPHFDVAFFGTVHGDRTAVAAKVLEECKRLGLRAHFFLYAQGTLMQRFRRFQSFLMLQKSGFSISAKALNQAQIERIVHNSKAILDIQHPDQNGLTMRTFEVLCSGRKLITTNEFVREAPFYSPSRVHVISRTNPELSQEFLSHAIDPFPEDLWRQYSILGWAKTLLGTEENDEPMEDV